MTAKITTQTIAQAKGNRPLVAVTAYDSVMAHFADKAGVDFILVGDSVGTTQLGFDTTIPVTLDMMCHHTAAVSRAKLRALLVADIPFAVAHDDFSVLLAACRRLMQEGGAEAVKIEGGASMAPSITRLVEAGVPVLGHIGLLPQQFHKLGGYRKFGRDKKEKSVLVDDALALEKAGAFAVIGEMIDGTVAGAIASQMALPLVGIGSGPDCDGQILVCNDLLGMTSGPVPSFVKKYAEVGAQVQEAFSNYADEVRGGNFPE